MIVTVTLNAALDRTLTVPNFQLGHRHRASQALTLAGGKGINIARALKLLDVPVVATGLVGGRTGQRILEELSAEAILNDFVRIEDESRTSTAVVDPTRARSPRSTSGARTSTRRSSSAAREAPLPRALRRLRRLRGVAAARRGGGFLRGGDSRPQPARHRAPCSTPRASRCGAGSTPSRSSSLRTRARRRARRPGVRRDGGLLASRSTDRGARRAQRADHAGVRLLRAAARGPARDGVPRARRARRHRLAGRRGRRPARGFLAALVDGPLARRTRCAAPSPRARRRRSRSAPAASTRARRPRLASEVDVAELEPVASG